MEPKIITEGRPSNVLLFQTNSKHFDISSRSPRGGESAGSGPKLRNIPFNSNRH